MGQFLPFTVNKDWEWDKMGHYYAGFCFSLGRALSGFRLFLDFPFHILTNVISAVAERQQHLEQWGESTNLCSIEKRGWQSNSKALLHFTDICGHLYLPCTSTPHSLGFKSDVQRTCCMDGESTQWSGHHGWADHQEQPSKVLANILDLLKKQRVRTIFGFI